eukprot:7286168-Karenia_brevis.AAC.1
MKTFRCGFCNQEKLRDEFLPMDVSNRGHQTLGCKACKPTPPNERRKRHASSSSAGQTQSPADAGSSLI